MSTKRGKFLEPIIVILILVITFAACGKESQTLDKNTRQLVETIARSKVVKMDSVIKKDCDEIYNSWYDRTVDSLYKIRRDEIENIKYNTPE